MLTPSFFYVHMSSKREILSFCISSSVLELKKLHDLLVLKITQPDEESKKHPLVQIVGRGGIKWEPEFPVDQGWVDIYVPRQKSLKHQYVIEVETGYDLNCSEILRKHERFRKALTKRITSHVGVSRNGKGLIAGSETIYPKLCVVIPEKFAEFISLFKAKKISVFLWEGKTEWKCKHCKEITLGEGPWKPLKCVSCGKPDRSLQLTGLKDFEMKEAFRVP